MWELDLESESVEDLIRFVFKFELIGVFIELENLQDLGNDIEIFLFL